MSKPKSSHVAEARGDFLKFCELIRIVPKSGPQIPLKLNAIQSIFHIERTGRDVVLKPRQIGLTTMEVARDLWTFLTVEGAQVTVVCQSVTDQGPLKTISKMIAVMIAALRKAGWPLEFETESRSEWTLKNGNCLRIIVAGASEAAAEKKGRSGTITRLHLTEVAFYEYAEETLNALLECVPDSGEVVIESTANGAAGLFYNYYQSADSLKSSFKAHFYPWFAQPEYRIEVDGDELFEWSAEEIKLLEQGVTPGQIKWRRLKIADKGRSKFDQEYPEDSASCFVVSGRSYFDIDALAAIQKSVPIETRNGGTIRIFRRPVLKSRYVLALDPSEGVGGDPSAGILLDVSTGAQCATIDGQFSPAQLAEIAAALGEESNNATIAPERNNHGHAVLQALAKPHDVTGESLYHNVHRHDDGKTGFLTNQVTRPQIISDLEDAVRNGLLGQVDPVVIEQFRTFVIKNGKPQAAVGAHDDLVIAYAICWTIRQRDMSARAINVPPLNRRDAPRFAGSRGYG